VAVFLATRKGHADMLVPTQWHDSYVRMGCTMAPAPAGSSTVTQPTPFSPPVPPPAPKAAIPDNSGSAKPGPVRRARGRRKKQ